MHGLKKINHITIRTDLKSGDIGYIIYLHGILYKQEYDYGIELESYVAAGISEFYENYNADRNRVWVCEHDNQIIGFLLLMDRGEAAQLRYFLIRPEYRGIGLGNKLMELYMEFFYRCGYKSSYLWTTHELDTAAHLYQKHGFKLTEEKESTAFGKHVVECKYELVT
ncbi:MAG: N-acetyltransferase [Anaerolineales bacterium]|nr:MAG: N-acetyltransferase [Anaerolineales bacterium]